MKSKLAQKLEKRKLPDFVILAGGFCQFFKSNKICFYFVINFIKIIFQLPVIATLTIGFDGTICTRDNTANELFSKWFFNATDPEKFTKSDFFEIESVLQMIKGLYLGSVTWKVLTILKNQRRLLKHRFQKFDSKFDPRDTP